MPRVLVASDPYAGGAVFLSGGRVVNGITAFNLDTREAKTLDGKVIKVDEIRARPGFDLAVILSGAKRRRSF